MSAHRTPAEIVPVTPPARLLTAAEFHRLADVPPEVEWFANLSNVHTRRVYENAIRDFMGFTGIVRPEEFRTVTRAHIIAWRDDLVRRGLKSSVPIENGDTRKPRTRILKFSSQRNVEVTSLRKSAEMSIMR
jgi:hypothetical protein